MYEIEHNRLTLRNATKLRKKNTANKVTILCIALNWKQQMFAWVFTIIVSVNCTWNAVRLYGFLYGFSIILPLWIWIRLRCGIGAERARYLYCARISVSNIDIFQNSNESSNNFYILMMKHFGFIEAFLFIFHHPI